MGASLNSLRLQESEDNAFAFFEALFLSWSKQGFFGQGWMQLLSHQVMTESTNHIREISKVSLVNLHLLFCSLLIEKKKNQQ